MKKVQFYVTVLVLVFSIIGILNKPVSASGSYYYKRIVTQGHTDSFPVILSTDSKSFVSTNNITTPNASQVSNGLFYFNGQQSTLIASGENSYFNSASMNDDYIAYVQSNYNFNQGTVPGVIYLYNRHTGVTTQVTNDQIIYKGNVKLVGDSLVWNEATPSNTYTNIWLYTISANQLTQVTNDADQGISNSAPLIVGQDIYWQDYNYNNNYSRLDDYHIINGSTDVVSYNSQRYQLNSDGNTIVWVDSDQGIGNGVYMLKDGVTSKIGQGDYVMDLSVKGNLVIWISADLVTGNNSHFLNIYNVSTGNTEVISGGPDLNWANTDGSRVMYKFKTTDGSAIEPAILDTSTGQTTYIDYPGGNIVPFPGHDNLSPFVVSSDFAAWIGYQNQSNGPNGPVGSAGPAGVTIAEPSSPPAAPNGLSAKSPTHSSPSLSWNAVNNVASYNVYRNGVLLSNTTIPSYTDTLNQDGSYTYTVTAVNYYNLESSQSTPIAIVYDTTPPTGTFTGNTTVIRALSQKIIGTAGDGLSGVGKIEIVNGSKTLSSAGGAITLSCNAAKTSCTWTADPTSLTTGSQTLTLRVTDLAGNVFTTTKNYLII